METWFLEEGEEKRFLKIETNKITYYLIEFSFNF